MKNRELDGFWMMIGWIDIYGFPYFSRDGMIGGDGAWPFLWEQFSGDWRVLENWSMNSDMCGHFESDHWIIGMINSIVG